MIYRVVHEPADLSGVTSRARANRALPGQGARGPADHRPACSANSAPWSATSPATGCPSRSSTRSAAASGPPDLETPPPPVTSGAAIAEIPSALAGETAVAIDGALDPDTQRAPLPGPVQVSGAEPDPRGSGLAPAPPQTGALGSPAPTPPVPEPAEHDGGEPVVRRRAAPGGGGRWQRPAGAAIAIAATVALVAVLSPAAAPEVIGDGTPSAIGRPTPTVIGVSLPQPTPSFAAAKSRPRPHPTRTPDRATHSRVRRHGRDSADDTAEFGPPRKRRATPAQARTTATSKSTPPPVKTTAPSTRPTTAPPSGPADDLQCLGCVR